MNSFHSIYYIYVWEHSRINVEAQLDVWKIVCQSTLGYSQWWSVVPMEWRRWWVWFAFGWLATTPQKNSICESCSVLTNTMLLGLQLLSHMSRKPIDHWLKKCSILLVKHLPHFDLYFLFFHKLQWLYIHTYIYYPPEAVSWSSLILCYRVSSLIFF